MGTPVAVGKVIEVVVHRVKASVDPMPLVPASEAALVSSAEGTGDALPVVAAAAN